MYLHDGQTTNNRSEGYNYRLSQFMGKHPNLYNFISVLKDEFQVAVNNASTASVGRTPGVNAPNTKNARSIKARQKMQENIRLGKTDLLTYQQAIDKNVAARNLERCSVPQVFSFQMVKSGCQLCI